MGIFRPTCAEIDLSVLKKNYRELVKRLLPSVRVMAMVKADAYGHGAVQVSKALSELSVAALGVATVEEGLELRESAITTPILVLGGLMGVGTAAAGMMVGANLTPVVHSAETLDFLEATAKAAGRKISIHLKIDTGMTRLGVMPQALPHFLDRLSQCAFLRLDGVMTHFANAGDDDYSSFQLKIFEDSARLVEKSAGTVPVWHVANSAGIAKGRFMTQALAGEHWVRPGLMLYESVMGIKSKIAMIKSVPPKTKISYGCTFETAKPSRIGVVPIGYADGYPWALSNKASVIVNGERAPVVGAVTMDMTMIDLTDLKESHVGDEVILMGGRGKNSISVGEVAKLAGTIPYEIFCGISKRMPRIYI